MTRATSRLPWARLLLLVCGAVLVWHSLQYDFVTDDAYISFVYSRNLAEHGALVFNPGDPVEGYTNFLWTFVLGLLMIPGLPPEITSRVLGTGFGLGTLVVAHALVAWLLARPRRGPAGSIDGLGDSLGDGPGDERRDDAGDDGGIGRSGWPLVAPALLALCAGVACWSSGGLETQMFTFWVAGALYAYVRGHEETRWLRRAGVLLALAAMTRPEGLLITGLVGLHRLVVNLVRERRLVPTADELWCLGLFLLVWGPWYAWRWWYYGYPFPNTYYVKAAGDPPPGYAEQLMRNGLYYVGQWARQTRVLYAAPVLLAGLLVARPGTRRWFFGSLAVPLAAVYLVYTVRVGGDFMGLHRFVMPLFFIAAVACALGLRLVLSSLDRQLGDWLGGRLPAPGRAACGVALVAVVLGSFAVDQQKLTAESTRAGNWQNDHGIDTPAFLQVYAHDRAAIGAHMRSCFEEDDFSIVGGAGAQPYHGRMRAIDVFGLVSSEIAHQVPPTRPRAGHNKWGPDSLLLKYDPEFVFSCYSIHAEPHEPRFNCNPGFWLRNGYEIVTLHIPAMVQQGTYYSFFKRKDRDFQCEGLIRDKGQNEARGQGRSPARSPERPERKDG